ncbi:MAG: tetratricopeptide repeat protein [Candidatus Latescibacteria bacterium]|nr:tetratricopeptide repeat protein [Candidatus Latescibacterota bacterium]
MGFIDYFSVFGVTVQCALYYNLGLTYARLDKKSKAKWAYEEALARDVNMVTAYVNLGNISFHEGDYHKAIGLYLEALKRDGQAYNARANMGWALYSVGREREAREAWETVLRVVPGHRSAVAGMERIGR